MDGTTSLSTRAVAGLAAFFLAFQPALAYANPQGGVVSGGQATISQSGNTLDITQSSNKAVIDWRSFNIGSDEVTAFHQPSASSMTLNRVNDANPSQILGRLTANGQIVLVNPNGVFFGSHSQVDVSGLIATTANISNQDFMAGRLNFSQPGNPGASIVNQGTISAKHAGLVGFVAPNVENDGVITATLGKVTLASGDTFTLDLAGDHLIEVAVSDAVGKQIVSNGGTIQADGGNVTLTAAAARQVVDSLVSNSGVIEANAFDQQGGTITLYAEGSNAVSGNVAADKGQKTGTSQVVNSGTLSASGKGSGQTGGNITVTGDNVDLAPASVIDASGDAGGGNVKVGGDFHGKGNTQTAINTTVEAGSTIDASAITSGNGGNVAVWSNNNTIFAGTITAKGGAQSGNGGYVETSGHNLLATGTVNASAPNGNAGTWLLDPNNIDIEQSSCTGTSCTSADTISTSLSGGTNVTVTTTDGIITLGGTATATITDSGSTNTTLDFEAGTDIVMSNTSAITASGTGKLDVTFDADTATGGGAIQVNSGSSIITNGGNIVMGGQGSPATSPALGDAFHATGIEIDGSATINAGSGNIAMSGQGFLAGTINNWGIALNSGSVVETSGTGTITLTGTGGGTTGNSGTNYNIGVGLNGDTVSSGAGAITVTGSGGYASSGNSYGVYVADATINSASGAITLGGTGGTGGTNDWGIYAYYASNVIGGASDTGDITLIADTVSLANFSAQTTGAVTIEPYTASTTIGFSGGAGTLQVTQAIMDSIHAPTVVVGSSTSGDLTTGAFTWESTLGNLTLYGNNSIIGGNLTDSTASGTLTVKANGDITQNTNIGITASNSKALNVVFDADTALGGGAIVMNSGGSSITSNGGNITLGGGANAATTAAMGDATNIQGINLSGATLDAGGGNITMTGTGYAGAASISYNGILLLNNSVLQTSGGGNISLTGTGGGIGNGSNQSNNDYGIYLRDSGSRITVVNGNMTLTGTGGNNNGGSNVGLELSDGVLETTGMGDITLTGTSGGTGGNDHGISVAATIRSTATQTPGTENTHGAITLTGTGDGGGGNGVSVPGGYISSVDGDISITGTGANSGGDKSHGIGIYGGSTVTSTGNAAITLTGTGNGGGGSTGSDGIVISDSGTKVTSATGAISITGTGGSGSGGSQMGVYIGSSVAVTSTGTAPISITGIAGIAGSGNYGIYTLTGSNVIGGGSDTGAINLIADTVSLANFSAQTTGAVTIEPYTASTTVGVAGGAGTLGITSGILGSITAGSLTIGSASDTGLMTIASYAAWNAPTSFITKSTGSISVTGDQTSTSTLAFTGPATLSGNITDTGTTFNSALTLGTDVTIDSGSGTATFGSTVDGAHGLTASAGTFSLASAWGGSAPLGAVSLTSTNNLTLPAISAASLFARATGGTANLTLTGQITASGTGTPVTLVAGQSGGAFINNVGAGVISLTGTGSPRWLIYSTSPSDNTLNGLAENFHRYSCTYGGSCPALGSGNGLLYSLSPTITVTANDDSGTYGSIAAFSSSYSGFINGDISGTALSGSPSLTTNATTSTSGNYNYSATPWTITAAGGTLTSPMGYQLTYVNGTLAVAQKALTITGVSGTTKVYDSTTGDSITGTASLNGVVASDVVNLANGTASFGDPNVGAGKTVIFSGYSISGADAANYALSQPANGGANITPAALSVKANDQSKNAGAIDPALTYIYLGLQGGDNPSVFSGNLSRAAGETAGAYPITLGTLMAGNNYSISFTPGIFTILATSGRGSSVPLANMPVLLSLVEAAIDQRALQKPQQTRIPPTDMIYVDVSLLESLGYGENDAHRWWDVVLPPGTRGYR